MFHFVFDLFLMVFGAGVGIASMCLVRAAKEAEEMAEPERRNGE